jgi:hypothetical protein
LLCKADSQIEARRSDIKMENDLSLPKIDIFWVIAFAEKRILCRFSNMTLQRFNESLN